ncbi:MAG: hypothetical protein ACRETN_01360 [Nevskiales bacterium]
MDPGNKQSDIAQTCSGLRHDRNRYLFLAAVAGLGFTAAKLLGTTQLATAILLIVSLAFFVVTLGAVLLTLQCQIISLQKNLAGQSAGMSKRVAEWAEHVSSAAFIVAVLVLVAAVIVHLPLGGIAAGVAEPEPSQPSDAETNMISPERQIE